MKIIKFLKDWTLPVSMGTGALLYLVFAYVPQLDEAALFFDPVMEAILPMFMFLVLLLKKIKLFIFAQKILIIFIDLEVQSMYKVI